VLEDHCSEGKPVVRFSEMGCAVEEAMPGLLKLSAARLLLPLAGLVGLIVFECYPLLPFHLIFVAQRKEL